MRALCVAAALVGAISAGAEEGSGSGSGTRPLSCNWGGSSNADAQDDDANANAMAFPTECTSTDYSQLSPERLGHPICGESFRCLTAVITVEAGFDDEVGLGCVSDMFTDDTIEEWLFDMSHFGPEAVQSVSNCSTPNCNPCGAAVDQPGWFWHTLAGKAAIGAAIFLLGFLGMWMFGCVSQRRCMCFWSLSQAYQASFRDPHSNSETHPLVDEPVPPSYQEAAGDGDGVGDGDGDGVCDCDGDGDGDGGGGGGGPGPYTEPAGGGGGAVPASSHYEDDLQHLLQPVGHRPAYPLAPPPAYLQADPKGDASPGAQ